MNDKQPEALWLAEFCELISNRGHGWPQLIEAAAELRRLHEVEKQRDALLHSLKLCRAAIAKAESKA
jgi:hypothetical protein